MWIALVARSTRANGPMQFRQTLCIHAALFNATGQHTGATNAFICVGTLVVRPASRLILSNWHTAARAVGNGVGRTAAQHCAQWQCVQHLARLLWRTHVGFGAWILAACIDTCQLCGTFRVVGTLRLFTVSGAFDVRIAGGAWLTCAQRLMTAALTTGGHCARVRIAHGATNTIQAIAGFIVATIFVVLAHTAHTGNHWITLRTLWTNAVGTMVLCQTFGATAALCWTMRAWIQAFLVVTRLIVRTVRVSFAFGCI